jgi:uncharacterized protein
LDDPDENIPSQPTDEPHVSPWILIALEAILLPVALGVGWLVGVDPTADIEWTPRSVGLGIAAAMPPLASVLLLDWLRPAIWQGMFRAVEELLLPALRGWSWGQLVLVSLLAGLGEELLFRGVMLAALVPWIGLYAALALSSVIFGAIHAITRMYVLYATLMGLYLAILWLATDNLAIPIVAHATYDFAALAWFLRWRSAPAENT